MYKLILSIRECYQQIIKHLAPYPDKTCITHIKKSYRIDGVMVQDRSQNRPKDYSAECAR